MNEFHYLGLEVCLVTEEELEQTIEESYDLPYPFEGSYFSLLDPNDWVNTGTRLRTAFQKEEAHQLDLQESAFFLSMLDYCGEDMSEIELEADQSGILRSFIEQDHLVNFLTENELLGHESLSFQQLSATIPYQFYNIPYERLLKFTYPSQNDISEEEALEDLLQLDDNEYWYKTWIDQLSESIQRAKERALALGARFSLFIYPKVHAKIVEEVWEDEEPLASTHQILDLLRNIQTGKIKKETSIPAVHPFMISMLKALLLAQIKNYELVINELKIPDHDSPELENWFNEHYKIEDFLGQPKKLMMLLASKIYL
ncbi:MAG: hypothetical protein AAFO07_10330 [Bacteroidota bacterium]